MVGVCYFVAVGVHHLMVTPRIVVILYHGGAAAVNNGYYITLQILAAVPERQDDRNAIWRALKIFIGEAQSQVRYAPDLPLVDSGGVILNAADEETAAFCS